MISEAGISQNFTWHILAILLSTPQSQNDTNAAHDHTRSDNGGGVRFIRFASTAVCGGG
jgi:hypothetical protein